MEGFISKKNLEEIMRQKDDFQYAQLLNRLRIGEHTKKDIDTLQTRVIAPCYMDKDYPLKERHIFLTNELVDTRKIHFHLNVTKQNLLHGKLYLVINQIK